VSLQIADVDALTDEAAEQLFRGHEALVFAAGADDRTVPPRPAYPFFHRANVETPARLVAAARRAGVRRAVVLGSYFAHFDRVWPELELAKHHPYIRSRRAQEAACLAAAAPELVLTVLELPYIFGSMPGRAPLWAPLVRYLVKSPVVLYTKGGSNAVAVKEVADATVAAITGAGGGGIQLVGDENLSWPTLIARLLAPLGLRRRVFTLPGALVRFIAGLVRLGHRLRGKESGLDPVAFVALQTREAFFDPGPARAALGLQPGGLDAAFAATVAASLPAAPGPVMAGSP
jgi:nucleoside-diphosphate-sugar epimerase